MVLSKKSYWDIGTRKAVNISYNIVREQSKQKDKVCSELVDKLCVELLEWFLKDNCFINYTLKQASLYDDIKTGIDAILLLEASKTSFWIDFVVSNSEPYLLQKEERRKTTPKEYNLAHDIPLHTEIRRFVLQFSAQNLWEVLYYLLDSIEKWVYTDDIFDVYMMSISQQEIFLESLSSIHIWEILKRSSVDINTILSL